MQVALSEAAMCGVVAAHAPHLGQPMLPSAVVIAKHRLPLCSRVCPWIEKKTTRAGPGVGRCELDTVLIAHGQSGSPISHLDGVGHPDRKRMDSARNLLGHRALAHWIMVLMVGHEEARNS